MNTIELIKDKKGVLSAELPVSKEQWSQILHDKNIATDNALYALFAFYFLPDRQGSCTDAAQKFGKSTGFYNAVVMNFGKAVAKKFSDFQIIDSNGEINYWSVPMGKGWSKNNHFIWQLRPELVEAMQDYVIDYALEQYRDAFDKDIDGPGDTHWSREEYKWVALAEFKKIWDPEAPNFSDMLFKSLKPADNLLASQSAYPRDFLVKLSKVAPEDVRKCFDLLYDERLVDGQRISSFIANIESLRQKYLPSEKSHFQTTNSVSTLLWLRYPEKYYIYKFGEYDGVCKKLGIEGAPKRDGSIESMFNGFAIYDRLNSKIKANASIRQLIDEKVNAVPDKYLNDSTYHTLTFDFGFWVNRYLKHFMDSKKNSPDMTKYEIPIFIKETAELLATKKNIIIQGAPGTGKTYNTAAIALALFGEDGIEWGNHAKVMERYKQLCDEGRISFTTFHQSMDYEDFIEGLKPKVDNGTVEYTVEPGIFRRICDEARTSTIKSEMPETLHGVRSNPTVWKVSLGGTGDNPTRADCLKNGHIRIGWAEYGDVNFEEFDAFDPNLGGKIILRKFQSEMQPGDIVVSCYSNRTTDAIGIVTGDYEYHAEGGEFPRYRKVHWILKGINEDIVDLNNGKTFTLGTIYTLPFQISDILGLIEKHKGSVIPVGINTKTEKNLFTDEKGLPYVLIIDEINRGNVSKIFGELITLLEADKRSGSEHPITLTLPYSKQKFDVPANLYVIGTMNTTDRSTGTIDYAVRRRFSFVTLPADREVVNSEIGKTLFDDVQNFIERHRLSDIDMEDLMPGHSYFMAKDEATLRTNVKYNLIPLIKEYIKDGILNVKSDTAKQYFEAWLELQPYTTDEKE